MSESVNHHSHSAPGPYTTHWHARLIELRDFIADTGHFPEAGKKASQEASLYVWLTVQRRAFLGQTLGFEKAAQMSILGDWVTTDQEVQIARRWRERLGQVAAFYAEHGRPPRYRHVEPGTERTLGIWIASQRHDLRHGKISEERVVALEEAAPWWRGRGARFDAGDA